MYGLGLRALATTAFLRQAHSLAGLEEAPEVAAARIAVTIQCRSLERNLGWEYFCAEMPGYWNTKAISSAIF